MARSLLALSLALLASSQVSATTPQCPGPSPPSHPVTADGVNYKILANGLSRPRGVILDSEGNLLVVEAAKKGISRIVLNDADGLDICVDSSSQIVSDATVIPSHILKNPQTSTHISQAQSRYRSYTGR